MEKGIRWIVSALHSNIRKRSMNASITMIKSELFNNMWWIMSSKIEARGEQPVRKWDYGNCWWVWDDDSSWDI
jgi:hypothetical protein